MNEADYLRMMRKKIEAHKEHLNDASVDMNEEG